VKARINKPILVPPSESICDMLGVSAKITIQFVTKIGIKRGRKSWQIIKDVVSRRRQGLMEKLATIYYIARRI
jgi:hypothetical protein